MSETNSKPNPCSVCGGTGKPGEGMITCICQGEGTAEAELKYLRQLAEALRATFQEVQVRLTMMGHNCSKPSQILPAIEALHQRCTDAEDEYVKLKRQRVAKYGEAAS